MCRHLHEGMWNVSQINFNFIYIRTEFTVDVRMTSGSTHLLRSMSDLAGCGLRGQSVEPVQSFNSPKL